MPGRAVSSGSARTGLGAASSRQPRRPSIARDAVTASFAGAPRSSARATIPSRPAMADFTATSEQTAIIETDEPRFIVRAAAGSGKTYVLVQRYLRHVLDDGCDPRSILAFTYTTKAAAEMRLRVVQELRKRDRPDLAQAVETGPISTIHSFCERLLRENALEAGIDPDFQIASEADASEMQRAAIRQVLTSTDGVLSDGALSLIGELTGRMEFRSTGPYDFLESAVFKVLLDFRSAGLDPSHLEAPDGDPDRLIRTWHGHILASLQPEVARKLEPLAGTPGFYPAAIELSRRPVS